LQGSEKSVKIKNQTVLYFYFSQIFYGSENGLKSCYKCEYGILNIGWVLYTQVW